MPECLQTSQIWRRAGVSRRDVGRRTKPRRPLQASQGASRAMAENSKIEWTDHHG
jgi:hypothetical protein